MILFRFQEKKFTDEPLADSVHADSLTRFSFIMCGRE